MDFLHLTDKDNGRDGREPNQIPQPYPDVAGIALQGCSRFTVTALIAITNDSFPRWIVHKEIPVRFIGASQDEGGIDLAYRIPAIQSNQLT
jgi:hypothetical protein